MKLYRVIDKATGLFIEDKFEFNPETEIGLDVIPAQGFIHAKWDFVNECWIEGATQEEIAAIQQAQPSEPTLEERVGGLEITTDELIEVIAQIEGVSL